MRPADCSDSVHFRFLINMTRLTIRIGEAEITVELSGCNAEFDGSTLRIHAPSTIINNVPLLPYSQPLCPQPNYCPQPNTYPWSTSAPYQPNNPTIVW